MRSAAILWILVFVSPNVLCASQSSVNRDENAARQSADWSTYADRVNGFSVRFPPGSALDLTKPEIFLSLGIDPSPEANRGLWGVSIMPILNPGKLSSEQLYRANLAALDERQKKEPGLNLGGTSSTKSEREVIIGGRKGYERTFAFANGYLIKDTFLAWEDKGFQISYIIPTLDMSDKQRAGNARRTKLLDDIIATIRKLI